MALNKFDKITSNANIMELMDLESLIEQTEKSLFTFTISDNIETSKIAKILFNNLIKMHSDLSNRIVEHVTGDYENIQPPTIKTNFDEKQFISQTYIPKKPLKNNTSENYKYTLLKETSIENYTRMIQEITELEATYNKNPDDILHQKIKILQTKINRQKKRISSISNKIY